MTETVPNTEGLTFEKVWAMFQETDRKFQETDRQMQETARQMKETREMFKETDRKMQETDRRMKETDAQISRLGSRIGQLIEHFAASNILEKFRDLGYEFNRVSRNHTIKSPNRQKLAEIDLFLENGDYAMVVEVKSLFTRDDVNDHLDRMDTVRRYADLHGDRRKYLGAAAGALMADDIGAYALACGLFVVTQTGDTVRIAAPGTARTW
jgi:hypothetical protein